MLALIREIKSKKAAQAALERNLSDNLESNGAMPCCVSKPGRSTQPAPNSCCSARLPG
jgi:hypothetical protein